MTNNRKNNPFSYLIAFVFLLITFIFVKNLAKTPASSTVFDTDGLEKEGGISPIVEQSTLAGRFTKIYAPNNQYYDIYADAPRRGSLSADQPSGNTVDYLNHDVELLQFVRNSNGSWVQVHDLAVNQEYWVSYEATLPSVPKVNWDN